MATRLKKYKVYLLLITKMIAFIIAVGCVASSITRGVNLLISYDNRILSNIFRQNYFLTKEFGEEMRDYLGIFHRNLGPNKYGEFWHGGNFRTELQARNGDYGNIDYNYFSMTFEGPGYDKDAYRKYPAYLLIDESGVEAYPVAMASQVTSINWVMDNIGPKNKLLYLGFKDAFIRERTGYSEKVRKAVLTHLGYIAGLILLSAFATLYLIINCGKRRLGDKQISLLAMDKLYNDLNVTLCIGLIYVGYKITFALYRMKYKMPFELCAESIIISTVILTLFLGLCRHKKNNTLWKHTFIYHIYDGCRHIIKGIYDQGSVGKKVTMMVVGYSVLVIVTLPVFPITIFFALKLMGKKVRDYIKIREEITAIKEGAATGEIDIMTQGELRNLAEDVNHIKEGFNLAVENEMKSERMKTELITNVSHDLRTPLTSIITFTDLLKHDKDEEKRQKHIITIEKKAYQLKKLTDDLFEAAKASSGNIAVNSTKINMLALINQAMGELHERIEDKGLMMELDYTEPVEVIGDGRLLWRVVENLLTNIMKYSLNRSRVYIDINHDDQWVTICFKNISAYRLNLPAEELMERFKRGDASRSTEGTGLGLSIVKSLMEVQGGSFRIDIDGDLFKATIQLPKYNETKS